MTGDEKVLLPNHPVFRERPLPWIHLYELARHFEAASDAKKLTIDLDRWARLAAATTNPADIRGLLQVENSPLPRETIKADLKLLFQNARPEQLPELQKDIGCVMLLDLPRKDESEFQHKFQPPTRAKLNALNRTYGGDRFLQVKLTDQLTSRLRGESKSKEALQKSLKAFFDRPIRIGNRVFHMILRKDSFVWLASMNDTNWRSVQRFINDILDLELNKKMTVAKWVARTSLVLSATHPTITFRPENIRRVPDVYSDSLIISRNQMKRIAETLGLHYLPSAIQGSIANQPCVWRLGVPDEAGLYSIQLWDCPLLNSSRKHVFIIFKAHCYSQDMDTFVLREANLPILTKECRNMGVRGKSEIMTDGAGVISRAAATEICRAIKRTYDTLPSVYQARIGFAKGLWFVDPQKNPLETTVWIEIRDSQWKADSVAGFSYAFNLCRVSGRVTSSRMGKQLIPVLASRGVETKTFRHILEQFISSTIQDLNSSDPVRLAQTIAESGDFLGGRKSILGQLSGIRHDPSRYRSFRDAKQDSISDYERQPNLIPTSDSLDPISLAPLGYAEHILSMLSAGFSPRNRIIVEKVRHIKQEKIQNATKFSIPLTESTYVYVMPDPTGTLKENEAFLQLSDFRDPKTGVRISRLICPALVSRSPCVAPIDVRKVNMVDNEILRETYFDVLVCSILGERSLLSLLSGGDYDGDQASVIWDPRIVDEFQNADPEKYLASNVDKYFDSVWVGTVEECLLKSYRTDPKAFVKEAQAVQLAGLFTPSSAGFYAYKQSTCEYMLGADHDLTWKVGEIYVKCLDAPKTGLVLKQAEDQSLEKTLKAELTKITYPDGKNVLYFDTRWPLPNFLREDTKEGPSNGYFSFARGGKRHVLDEIMKVGTEALLKHTHELKNKDRGSHDERAKDRDEDLIRFYDEQKKTYDVNRPAKTSLHIWIGVLRPLQRAMPDLNAINRDLVAADSNERKRDLIWEAEFGANTKGTKNVAKNKKLGVREMYQSWSYHEAFKFIPEEEDLANHKIDLKEYQFTIKAYLEGLGPTGYALLKASCLSYCTSPESYLPYELAFREICYLKALACNARDSMAQSLVGHNVHGKFRRPPPTISTECYLSSTVKRGIVRTRRQDNEGEKSEPV